MKRPITRPRAKQLINQIEIMQKMALDLEIELTCGDEAPGGETNYLFAAKEHMTKIMTSCQHAVIFMTYYAQRK